jgi:adhesin transport system membrane fusion protein
MLKKLLDYNARRRQFEEDKEYLTDINAANLYGASFTSHLILWIFLGFALIALIWASLATLDEVTRGTGKIIPSSHIQVIQNLEGGILSEMLVKEGDMVEKGQTLLRLDDVRFSSSYNETKVKHQELLINTARLSAEVNDKPFEVPADLEKNYPGLVDNARRLYHSRLNELQANIDILEQQARQKEQELVELTSKSAQLSRSYQLLKQELDMSEPLVKDGALSEVELLRIKRNANDLQGELSAAQLAIPRLRSFIAEAQNKIDEQKIRFRTEALKELNETKSELDQSSQSILALEDRVTRTRIVSPVKGTVKEIKIRTIGGVIQPGMDLMEIVPIEDQLLVEAQIRPADIAFLRPGQQAMVKLTAYDFSIYGGLDAELEHISADTIVNEEDKKSYFIIRLRTHKNYLEKNGEKLSIIPGMTTDVDILTGKKTVLDYILKPILKAKQRAMRER